MKLVYAGHLDVGGTCRHRMEAMRRVGLDPQGFDFNAFLPTGPVLWRVVRRLVAGPHVDRMNAALLDFCDTARPDMLWADKPIWLYPATLEALRTKGIVLVNFIIDNPFGSMNEPGWRHVKATIPLFDLIVVTRESSRGDFAAAGARATLYTPLAFDPFIHFPPRSAPPAKRLPLAYIGTALERRPEFIGALVRRGLPVTVRGPRWRRARLRLALAGGVPVMTPGVWEHDYRKAIWETEVCLGFVTHANHDRIGHKSVEIAACGSFLLAERSEGHTQLLDEGREAAFFGSVNEAADLARYHMSQPERREAMARAGCLRIWNDGHSNDERLAAAFAEIDPRLAARLTANARAIVAARKAELGLT